VGPGDRRPAQPPAERLHRAAAAGRGPGADRALAAGLDADDALVIFPEGGNFTPERWVRAIARLRRLSLHKMAARASA